MNALADVLTRIGDELKEDIWTKSDTYCLIDIGTAFEHYEIEGGEKYEDVKVVVPLKKASGGVNFMVNGNDLSDYSQLKSGIAVPEWVAEESDLSYKPYQPKSRMTLNMG